MELKWLEDFLSLARTRSFSRSAEERHVTQSAFSRRIKALELWVGAPLVDRSTYPARLTAAGRSFRDAAEDAVRTVLEARDELRGRQRATKDALNIYALHALSVQFLPRWLKSCKQALGPVEARVVPENLHGCVSALKAGSCDLVLCYAHPAVPQVLDGQRYPMRRLASERLVPVSAPDAHGRARFALPGAQRQPIPLLAYSPGTFLGQAVDFIVCRHAPRGHFQWCYENPMAEALRPMAIEGHGLAWLPETVAAADLAAGRLVQAGDATWCTPLEVCLYRARDQHRDLVERLWAWLDSGAAAA